MDWVAPPRYFLALSNGHREATVHSLLSCSLVRPSRSIPSHDTDLALATDRMTEQWPRDADGNFSFRISRASALDEDACHANAMPCMHARERAGRRSLFTGRTHQHPPPVSSFVFASCCSVRGASLCRVTAATATQSKQATWTWTLSGPDSNPERVRNAQVSPKLSILYTSSPR